jgi:hypothetical protein
MSTLKKQTTANKSRQKKASARPAIHPARFFVGPLRSLIRQSARLYESIKLQKMSKNIPCAFTSVML